MANRYSNPNFPGATFRFYRNGRGQEISIPEITQEDRDLRLVVCQVFKDKPSLTGLRGWLDFATVREDDLSAFQEIKP